MATDDVFTGIKSYHDMLKRAQALDPVLTYVLCDLVMRIKIIKNLASYETEKVGTDIGDHKYSYYFFLQHIDVLTLQVFHNLTVRVSRSSDSSTLVVRREFVKFVQTLKLTFDHEDHFVTIPN